MQISISRIGKSLSQRRRRSRPASFSACCGWSWAFVVFNLVFLAVFLLDRPVAAYLDAQRLDIRPVASIITDFGQSGWIIAVSLLVCVEAHLAYALSASWRKRWQAALVGQMALYLLLSIALSGLTANLLKRAIGRARPIFFEDYGIWSLHSFAGSSRFESFPSGHATTIGAFMMAMALLAPAFRPFFLVMGFWLGFSRVIVGAHYPSDVIAGLALGAWFALAVAILFARHGLLFRQSQSGWPELRRTIPLSMSPPFLFYRRPFAEESRVPSSGFGYRKTPAT